MSQLKLLLQVALRNLLVSPINLVIGAIMLVGTLVVVMGGAVLDSMDEAMSRSIISSVAGHLQVYSERSRDELSLFGNMGSEPDLAALDDFSRLKQVLGAHPNVERVVPMGINGALITSGNTVDLTLARLRDLYRQRDTQGDSPALQERRESVKSHVRQIVGLLAEDMQRQDEIVDMAAMDPADKEALARVLGDSFWARFEEDPYGALEFLENRIAPQVTDGDLLFLRYVGTDLDAFRSTFSRLRVVDGTAVPEGRRGMLLSKFFYEQFLKLRTARRLDVLKRERDINAKRIATHPDLQRWVKELGSQTREILFQLDPIKSRQARERLQRVLGSQEQDLGRLLAQFLTVDDDNFDTRYQQFYSELAPLLDLYRLRIGDDLTITAFTRTGYVQSVNVKVYGTYTFEGMEESTLAGNLNLMDLMSFRELYGYLTAERKAELEGLQQASGVKEVARERAEEELFGESNTLVAEATPGLIDEDSQLAAQGLALRREELARRVYSQQDIEGGVVLNAAVVLKDPERLEQTRAELEQQAQAVGLPLRVVSWQKASGLIGQFVLLVKLVLYTAVFIIFVVAMVVINNAMMMATLQRVQEVGTMRAIGAQRSFVLSMVLVETLLLGALCGGTGSLLGSLGMLALGKVGIPAGNEALYALFGGPRLFPSLHASNIIVALVIVLAVSALSTFYPAWLATRVSPLKAMQTDE
jgi:ABC-type lipoprotein release transport system permease subunit